LRFQVNKQRRVIGLGSYPAVSLADARAKAAAVHALIDKGIDPFEARKAAERSGRPVPTFAEIAARVIDDAQARSTNAKVRYQWARHLGPAYCGALLAKPVNEITTLDIAKVLTPVWRTKPEVARKLYPAIRRVFDRARVILRDQHGIELSRNPAEVCSVQTIARRKRPEVDLVIVDEAHQLHKDRRVRKPGDRAAHETRQVHAFRPR
jgi:hypothetical protein